MAPSPMTRSRIRERVPPPGRLTAVPAAPLMLGVHETAARPCVIARQPYGLVSIAVKENGPNRGSYRYRADASKGMDEYPDPHFPHWSSVCHAMRLFRFRPALV
jgi:hypothetical protein